LVPRIRTRFTLDGHACVDMSDLAMVRMEGRTAKRISFLVGRADVVQKFRKIGEFWYSSESHSTADVRFLGRTELIIKYLNYTITSRTGAVVTANLRQERLGAPDPSPARRRLRMITIEPTIRSLMHSRSTTIGDAPQE
jgi:hypothetical protein